MKRIPLIISLTLVLVGSAGADDWRGDAVLGGAIGGATGAAIGSAMGGRDAAIVGGMVGSAVGVAAATRDDYYRRPPPVYYRPAPVYYQPAPPPPVYGYRVYGPPPGYWAHRHEEREFHRHGPWHGRGWGHRRDWD